MMTLAFGTPYTHSVLFRRATRSSTRRSLVHPSSSMTASRSSAEATDSKAEMGGWREGISRQVGPSTTAVTIIALHTMTMSSSEYRAKFRSTAFGAANTPPRQASK